MLLTSAESDQQRRETESQDQAPSGQVPWFGLLVVIGWAYGAVPSVLSLFQTGRTRIDVSSASAPVGLAAAMSQLLWLAFVSVTILAILVHLRARPAAGAGTLAVFMAPWVAVQTSAVLTGEHIDKSAFMYPLAAVAVWLISPSLKHLRTLAILTTVTCIFSVLLGITFPALGNLPPPATGDKAELSGLLAGVYNHPNTLGMAAALGLPMTMCIRRGRLRLLTSGFIILAAGMAASRTALFAIGVEVLVIILLMRGGRARARLLAVTFTALTVLVVATPLSVTDASEYSGRGGIWLASAAAWRESPWWGLGPNFFREIASVQNDFGYLAFHAHNFFMHILTTTGVMGIGAMTIFIVAQARNALRFSASGTSALPAVYLAGFLGLSWLEVATDFRGLSTLGFVVWLPLGSFVFTRDRLQLPVQTGRKA